MADIVSTETRSRMMAGIRATNTKPEIAVRKALFARGFRYRIHAREISGNPDLLLPKYCAAVFVHGCFWHGHDCALFKWPKTNVGFWEAKIRRNQLVDQRVAQDLRQLGWRNLTIWECSLKGPGRIELDKVVERADRWIRSQRRTGVIKGRR
ncbi:MAG: very short patch repair endonuclease [Planctomycetaceae bacterium]